MKYKKGHKFLVVEDNLGWNSVGKFVTFKKYYRKNRIELYPKNNYHRTACFFDDDLTSYVNGDKESRVLMKVVELTNLHKVLYL